MKLSNSYLIVVLLLMVISLQVNAQDFVTVQDGKFQKGEDNYHYLGANYWFALYMGAGQKEGLRTQLEKDLDILQSLGIDNLRIMVGTEGPPNAPWRVQPTIQDGPKNYDDTLLAGLDFLLVEMAKREMHAVLCLTNFFQWSGGMAQYVSWADNTSIPYPHDPQHSWDEFQNYSASFFSNHKAQRYFRHYTQYLLKRVNSITDQRYIDDPTIMAWQLANEPRGFQEERAYVKWVRKTSRFIQRKDPNHLVSLGGEGRLTGNQGTAFDEVSALPSIDYLTAHIWIENWGWYNPQAPASTFDSALHRAKAYLAEHVAVANDLQKPIVLEEFGISRDSGSHNPQANSIWRNRYFEEMYEQMLLHIAKGDALAGSNFWSWSGSQIPLHPSENWRMGDPLVGDPPHEKQGWYSIYLTDEATLALFQKYAALFKEGQNISSAAH